MTGQVDEFDYPLDPQLIAQQPLTGRDESRLFVLRRRDEWYQHLRFRDLPTALHKGDLLVLNDTRVVPAKFFCRRETGGRVEGLFLSERADGAWEVLLKNAGKCHPGEQLAFQPEDATRLSLRENLGEGRWFVAAEPPTPAETVLHRVGVTPLPPYIHRADAARDAADRARYQTVYAARPGAVAAPTAGLHFTPELLASLEDAGIATTRLTLHVGMGTFAPVKSETVAQHRMHAEWYELPPAAAEAVNAARRDGRRVVAVGTTSVRVLEAAARQQLPLVPGSGWTDIFLYPPAEFLATDAMITNFHLPRSTLVMLVAAFCSPGRREGVGMILRAYAEAQRRAYRFFSYGDAMLLE